jgi:hypothetical protein
MMAMALGILMNTRGLMELIVLTSASSRRAVADAVHDARDHGGITTATNLCAHRLR